MKITDKLEAKDRGLVREVKVPKLRDKALEKEYSDVVTAHKQAKRFLKEKTQTEKELLEELNSTVLVGQKIEEKMATIAKNKEKVQPLITAQEETIATLRKEKEAIRKRPAPEKESEQKEAEDAKREELRTVTDVIQREEVVLQTLKARFTNLHVDALLLQTNHEEQSARYTKQREGHEKAVSEKAKAQELFDQVEEKLQTVQQKGEKFADDDLKNGEAEIEEARAQLKYKQVKAIGQTEDHWIFLLIQPEEYEGEVSVKETPSEPVQ